MTSPDRPSTRLTASSGAPSPQATPQPTMQPTPNKPHKVLSENYKKINFGYTALAHHLHHLHRLKQALAAQVGVAAGGADVGMAQQLLHLVQAAPGVHQK